MIPMSLARFLLALPLALSSAAASAFDHGHAAWDALLVRHVSWTADGTATAVDYAGFARDRAALKTYLDSLSAVTPSEFDAWPKADRETFLINAYNAFTVGLVLTGYPGLESIRDLGSLLRSPWKQRFFTLLGEQRHLDDVEHGLLRGAEDFDEPRIHFAVNCASIGCPALRPEAFTAQKLEQQLEDQTRRFLSDRTRNRYDAATGTLYLSSIFDWYGGDFESGWRGTESVDAFAARYADALGIDAATAARIASGDVDVEFLDYDWALNGE
jgi:hypothetical protein